MPAKITPMRALAWLLLGGLPPLGALAHPDSPDPNTGLRPENVTSLPYWMYAWVGSYYNGTTTFRFTPQESSEEDESVCSMFENRTLTFSYPSLAAITKRDLTDEDNENPVTFQLKSWRPGTNLHPEDYKASRTGLVDELQWSLESSEPPRYYYPSSSQYWDRQWELTLEEPVAMPFTVSGRWNTDSNGSPRALQVNMSSCNDASETWWGARFLTGDARAGIPVTDPSFRFQFDNQSASFQYTGMFRMNTDPGNDVLDNGDPEMSVLVGTVTVDFLGNIDSARSDILVPSAGGPRWIPVVGWRNGTGKIDTVAQNAAASRDGLGWIVWSFLLLGGLIAGI